MEDFKKLIPIKEENDQQLVSARDLHKGLEIKRRFSAWWKQNSTDFEENEDFTSVLVSTEVPNNGGTQTRDLQDYALTLDTAKEICMMSHTEKGKKIRRYFIQAEKERNELRIEMASQGNLPQTPEEKPDLTMQVVQRTKKRLDTLESDVDFLKNKQEIDSEQRLTLEKSRKKKCIEVCGGKNSEFYRSHKSRKAFAKLEHDLKDVFCVPTYASLKKDQYQDALDFIKSWYPDAVLKREIMEVNSQLSFWN